MCFYCVLPYKTALGRSWGGLTIYIYIYLCVCARARSYEHSNQGCDAVTSKMSMVERRKPSYSPPLLLWHFQHLPCQNRTGLVTIRGAAGVDCVCWYGLLTYTRNNVPTKHHTLLIHLRSRSTAINGHVQNLLRPNDLHQTTNVAEGFNENVALLFLAKACHIGHVRFVSLTNSDYLLDFFLIPRYTKSTAIKNCTCLPCCCASNCGWCHSYPNTNCRNQEFALRWCSRW